MGQDALAAVFFSAFGRPVETGGARGKNLFAENLSLTAQLKTTLIQAIALFAAVGPRVIRISSVRLIMSPLLMSPILRPRQTGRTCLFKIRSTSAAVRGRSSGFACCFKNRSMTFSTIVIVNRQASAAAGFLLFGHGVTTVIDGNARFRREGTRFLQANRRPAAQCQLFHFPTRATAVAETPRGGSGGRELEIERMAIGNFETAVWIGLQFLDLLNCKHEANMEETWGKQKPCL